MKRLLKFIFMSLIIPVLFYGLSEKASSQLYTTVTGTTFCAGGSMDVSYAVDYLFQPDNIFTVQLSNSSGSFTNPVSLGSFAGRYSNRVTVTIPINTSYGTGYRVRTVASDPATIGYDNGVDLTINAAPTPSISGNFSFCDDNRSQTYSTTSVANITYQWSVSGGTISGSSTGTSITVSWSANSGSVTLAETNSNTGCSASTTQNITVNPLPTPSISGDTVVCASSSKTYTAPSVNGINYQWSVSGGTISGSSTDSTVNISWGTGSSGTVSLSETVTATSCTASKSQTVKINPLPTPVINGNFYVCYNSLMYYTTQKVSGVSYQWTVTGGTINGSTTDTAVTVKWTGTSGTISLTETINSTNCTSSTSNNVTINSLPTPDISGNSVMCADSRTQVYTTTQYVGVSYKWSASGGTISGSSTGTSVTITWSGSSGTVYLKETIDLTGCTDSTSYNVIINPLPTPSISGQTSVCAGSTQNYSTPSASGVTYLWSVTGGSINGSSNTNAITVTWASGSNGLVRISETLTATGCSATTTQNIVINALPTPSINGSLTNCANNATQTYSTTAVSGLAYQWSVTGGTINGSSSNSSVSVTWSASSGTINLLETVTATGCTASASQNTILNPVPNPQINGTFTFCADNSTQSYSTTAVSGYSYQWSATGGSINGVSNTNTVSVTWANSTGNLSLVETITATGCSASTSQNIIMNPLPTPQISGNTSVCATSSQTYITTAAGGTAYQWSVSGGTISGSSTGTGINVNWGSGSAGTVTLKETVTATGCSASTTQNITINPLPTPSISGTYTMCADNVTQTYSTPVSGSVTYQWSVTGGTINGASNTNTVSVTWSAAAATINLTETMNGTGCSASTSHSITVNPLPTPQFSGPTQVCTYSTRTYTATQASGIAYQWSVSGGTISGASNNYYVSVTWANNPYGTVSLSETVTATGCSASTSQGITTDYGPNPQISGSFSVCIGSTNTYYASTATGVTYSWSASGGTISGSSTNSQVVVTWNSTASTLTLTETTPATGCSATIQQAMTINPLPTPQIAGNFSLCSDSKTQTYKATPYNTNASYQWRTTGGNINGTSTDSIVSITFTADTAYVKLIQTNTLTGCIDSTTKNVYVNTLPTPSISGNFTSCINGTRTYSAPSESGLSYSWSVSGGTINGTSTDSLVSVTWTSTASDGITLSEVINSTGCSATATQSVTVYPLPLPSISGNTVVCAKSVQMYSTPTGANYQYQWSVTNGTINGSANSSTVSITWNSTPGTVSLTETITATGCVNSVSQPVQINPLPVPTINGSNSVCVTTTHTYNTPLDVSLSYSWQVQGGTIIGPSNGNSINVTWTGASGVVKLIETINSTGCTDSTSMNVTINSLPNPNISGNFNSCAYANEIYSIAAASGNAYQWSVTGGNIAGSSTGSQITVTWGPAGNGTMTVTQTVTATQCSASTTQNVVINTLPTPGITGQSTACASNALSIPYYAVSSAGVTNNWTAINGSIDGSNTGSTVYVFWPSTGNGILRLTQTDINTGCSGSYDFNVTIKARPNPTITGDLSSCVNSTATYKTDSLPNTLNLWTAANGTITGPNNGTSAVVTWTTPDVGTVFLQQTNTVTGCSSTVSQDVAVHRLPTIVIIGPTKACTKQQIAYKLRDTVNVSATWAITGGKIIGYESFHTAIVIWDSTAVSGKIMAFVTNTITNCSNTLVENVSLYSLPIAFFTGSSTICQNARATYTADTSSAGVYNWDVQGGDITKISKGKISVSWKTVLIGKVSLTAINAAGCSSTYTSDVKVFPIPQPVITGDTSVCALASIKYSSSQESGMTNKWSVQNGTINGPNNDSTVIVTWTNQGPGVLSLTQTFTESGCETDTTYDVTVNPTPPKPTITQNVNTLSSSASNGNQWYENGTKIDSATGNKYTATHSGKYSVQVTNVFGCSSEMSDQYNFTYTSVPSSLSMSDFATLSIAPNPVYDKATISLNLGVSGEVSLTINNMLGVEVTNVVKKYFDSGTYNFEVNTSDLTDGIYFCNLKTEKGTLTVKFSIIK